MTDNEIVKALEEHYKQVDKGYSTHLEYGGKGDEHEEKYIYMLRDVLDLINRLQAKVIKEQNKNSKLRNERNPYDSKDETNGTICGLAHAIGRIKDLLKEKVGENNA